LQDIAKLRQEEPARPAAVIIQAISAIHAMERDNHCKGEKSGAIARRSVATAYIPSGKTRLQSSGV
jgi:hypothetical protein